MDANSRLVDFIDRCRNVARLTQEFATFLESCHRGKGADACSRASREAPGGESRLRMCLAQQPEPLRMELASFSPRKLAGLPPAVHPVREALQSLAQFVLAWDQIAAESPFNALDLYPDFHSAAVELNEAVKATEADVGKPDKLEWANADFEKPAAPPQPAQTTGAPSGGNDGQPNQTLAELITQFLHETGQYLAYWNLYEMELRLCKPTRQPWQGGTLVTRPSDREMEKIDRRHGEYMDWGVKMAATGERLAKCLIANGLSAAGVLKIVHRARGGGGGAAKVVEIWESVKVELQSVALQGANVRCDDSPTKRETNNGVSTGTKHTLTAPDQMLDKLTAAQAKHGNTQLRLIFLVTEPLSDGLLARVPPEIIHPAGAGGGISPDINIGGTGAMHFPSLGVSLFGVGSGNVSIGDRRIGIQCVLRCFGGCRSDATLAAVEAFREIGSEAGSIVHAQGLLAFESGDSPLVMWVLAMFAVLHKSTWFQPHDRVAGAFVVQPFAASIEAWRHIIGGRARVVFEAVESTLTNVEKPQDEPPVGPKRRRPTYERNLLWLRWAEEFGLKKAKVIGHVRSRWNALSDSERQKYAPYNTQVPKGKGGWDNVRKGIEAALEDRKSEAES